MGRLLRKNGWCRETLGSQMQKLRLTSRAVITFGRPCRFAYCNMEEFHLPKGVKVRRKQRDTTRNSNSKRLIESFVKVPFVYQRKMHLMVVWHQFGCRFGSKFQECNIWVNSDVLVRKYVVLFKTISVTNQSVVSRAVGLMDWERMAARFCKPMI